METAPTLAGLDVATPGLHPVQLPVDGQTASGLVAIPASGTSSTLVVLAKGFGGDVDQWRPLMQDLASRGALVVAMQYRGPDGAWKVDTAVADTLAATQALQAAHPEVERTILFGYSMGGEVTGLAVARAPTGTYTDWIEGSGVMDLAAEWREVVTFQPAIEAAAGGRPDQVAARYDELSPLRQVQGIATQGLRRAYLVHGSADTVVPAEQSDRMADALAQAGVPVSSIQVITEPGAWACTPEVLACVATGAPDAPANHEAGAGPTALEVLRGLVSGAPQPTVPVEHRFVEGATGSTVSL